MMRKSTTALILTMCLAVAVSAYAGDKKAPGVTVLGDLKDKYEAVTFNHENHALIAGNCGTCHHQHGSETQMCKDCHALGQDDFKRTAVGSFFACRNCHETFNPAYPELPGLKAAYHRQCFGCHGSMGKIGLDPDGCTEMCHQSREKTTPQAEGAQAPGEQAAK